MAEQTEKPIQSPSDTTPTGSIGRPADIEKQRDGEIDFRPQSGQSRRTIHGYKWILVLATVYIACFTYGLDTTIAADVQAAVVETFGQVEQLAWLGTGFFLGSVATILPIGHAFEKFDQKWAYIVGVVVFEVGSVVCGAAPNINALIIGRVIAGIGGSGTYIGGLQILTALTDEEERGKYVSLIAVFWGLGAILGPVIGGAFSDSNATWRWAFYINIVIAAVCAPVYLFYLPSIHPVTESTALQRFLTIDWVGAVLYAAIWVIFALVFTFAGNTWAWDDGRTIASLVVFGVLLIVFILQQRFAILTNKKNRIFPCRLVLSRTQVLLYVGMAATNTAVFIPIYYIPVYFQFVNGDTAIEAAVRLLPYLCVGMSLNFVVGYLLHKIPYYASLYLVAGIFILAGAVPLYTVNTSTPTANIYGYSVLLALGVGLTIQSAYTHAAVKLVKQGRSDEVPHAISFQNIAQIGTGGISLVIGGQIFQSLAYANLVKTLRGRGFSSQELRAAVAGAQSDLFRQIDPQLAAEATNGIVKAINNVYILLIAAGCMLIVSAVLMRWERLF